MNEDESSMPDMARRPGGWLDPEANSSDGWFRRHLMSDVRNLAKHTKTLVALLGTAPADADDGAKRAGKVGSAARSAWLNIQQRKPAGPKLPDRLAPQLHTPFDPRERAAALQQLVDEVSQALVDQEESPVVDVKGRVELLKKLEQINHAALEIERTLGSRD